MELINVCQTENITFQRKWFFSLPLAKYLILNSQNLCVRNIFDPVELQLSFFIKSLKYMKQFLY